MIPVRPDRDCEAFKMPCPERHEDVHGQRNRFPSYAYHISLRRRMKIPSKAASYDFALNTHDLKHPYITSTMRGIVPLIVLGIEQVPASISKLSESQITFLVLPLLVALATASRGWKSEFLPVISEASINLDQAEYNFRASWASRWNDGRRRAPTPRAGPCRCLS